MRFKCNKAEIKNLFVQDEVVADIINKDIKQHVTSSADSIPESTNRHQPFKRRVKIVYEFFDPVLQYCSL